ncbi:hypothetical protein LV779_30480 [Streptomyces thinghirensis]|nr:hypothetical protein [Streptomyces thinghirensis]
MVEPARSGGGITVTFNSGDTAEATVVGRDSGYDLAVVKVKGVSGPSPRPSATPTTAAQRPCRRHRRPLRPGRHGHPRHHQRQGSGPSRRRRGGRR